MPSTPMGAFAAIGNRRMAIRLFSAKSNTDDSSKESSEFKVFLNADVDKLNILNYVKGKAGIYL
jgi:hypothetical protein